MNKQREIRSAVQELRVKEGPGNTLTGSIAVFNSLSEDLGGFREILAPGCFSSSMGSDIRALINHNTSAVVGRTKAGTLRLVQSETGLQFECDLPDTAAARDLKVSVDRGDVNGCSFGFICTDDSWAADETGNTVRTVKDLELFEVSVGVTFPAYSDTNTQLRSRFPDGTPAIPHITPEKRANDNGCDCDCPECIDNDCEDCSDPLCIDENCLANRSLRNLRLAVDIALAI